MILSFGACNEQEKPAQKSLYEQGLEVVSLMEEAIHLDNYGGKFTDNHFEEKIEKLKEGDFSTPKKVYTVTVDKDLLIALIDLHELEESSSDELKNMVANKQFTWFMKKFIGLSGVGNLNITRLYEIEKIFVNTEITNNIIYIYTYEDATPVAVTFTMQEDGAVKALGNFILNKAFRSDTVEEVREYFRDFAVVVKELEK